MPPRLPRARIALFAGKSSDFVCSYCRRRSIFSGSRSLQAQWPLQHRRPPRPREASTVAPVTVVNAVKHIPQAALELYEALDNLRRDAEVYTSLSQLQLAMRGLESEHPVTRIALLSLDGFQGARRLARVLLADPLASETPWERRLLEEEATDGRALLLRYGERVDYNQRHPLLRTLTIPATTLHTHNLEILIQAVCPDHETDIRPLHAYLIPCLEIAGSSAARYSVVRYPVHKTLVFSEGLQGLPTYATIASAKGVEKEMIKGAVNTSWSSLRPPDGSDIVVAVNVERAEAAIQTFRKSLGNSVEYEHAWFDSGLPTLSNWVLEGSQPTSGSVKPIVYRLIASLLSATEIRIIAEETERLQKIASMTIPTATRSNLSNLISMWSENAHTELRDQLDLAFDSPGWRKLAWWKLPWRVDDVAMITTDILSRSWLTSAEKELIWLAGRVEQAGLYVPQPPITSSPEVAKQDADGEPMHVRQAAILSAAVPEATTETLVPRSALSEPGSPLSTTPKPHPQALTLARHALASTTAPSLQAIAQRLLLYSLSATLLTSTLSILMYISISTTSVYEAGTIAALGLVYAMRRLQNRWENIRVSWKEGIKEQGRTTLRAIERRWSDLIREGGKHDSDDASLGERQKAREAVARVRSALSTMGEKG